MKKILCITGLILLLFIVGCSQTPIDDTPTQADWSCSDSDEGNDPGTFGILTGFQGGEFYSTEDVCSDNSYLWESICEGEDPSVNFVFCDTISLMSFSYSSRNLPALHYSM